MSGGPSRWEKKVPSTVDGVAPATQQLRQSTTPTRKTRKRTRSAHFTPQPLIMDGNVRVGGRAELSEAQPINQPPSVALRVSFHHPPQTLNPLPNPLLPPNLLPPGDD